jgi:hypothetical protein
MRKIPCCGLIGRFPELSARTYIHNAQSEGVRGLIFRDQNTCESQEEFTTKSPTQVASEPVQTWADNFPDSNNTRRSYIS